jgi:FKBP-type peptidyl-prolyl cis-trans isomerase
VWDLALVLKGGGKCLLRVPPVLRYAARGLQEVIPPHGGLMFMIELIAVQK